jgi:hypothetical protein
MVHFFSGRTMLNGRDWGRSVRQPSPLALPAAVSGDANREKVAQQRSLNLMKPLSCPLPPAERIWAIRTGDCNLQSHLGRQTIRLLLKPFHRQLLMEKLLQLPANKARLVMQSVPDNTVNTFEFVNNFVFEKIL